MVNTITRPTGKYTDNDFDSWIVFGRQLASAAFPGWTDFNTPNNGNILLEAMAHLLDAGNYRQDQQHLERFATFLRQRSSAISLGKNVAFRLPGTKVASVDLEITFIDGQPRISNLVIPKGTQVTNSEGDVVFETTADLTIPAGSIQGTVSARNSTEHTEPFVAPGTPTFKFPLGSTPYVDGSAVVKVGVDTYAEVDDFLRSGPTDKVFRMDVDDQFRATAVFGQGTNGVIPTGSGTITYQTGGGAAGNLDFNQLIVFPNGNRFTSLSGEPVLVSVRNPSKSAGGVNAMTVEEFREAIQAYFRTVGKRSVASQDFADNAKKFRGVARAVMLTSDDDAGIPENNGKLYIVPVGGGLASSQFKTDLLNFIKTNYPPTTTFKFTVNDPSLKIISVSATVYLTVGIDGPTARAAIEQALDDFFSLQDADGVENPQIDFGFTIRKKRQPTGSVQAVLPWSDLFDVLVDAVTPSGLKVLRSVSKTSFSPANDINLNDTEFPVLGSIQLIDGDTGLAF